ncbi:MAG: DUF167 domain-containing protein [Rubripirellula sp.]
MRIAVHASPNAKRNHVGGCHDGALRVAVTAPADKGKANQAIEKMLVKALGLKSSQIELVRGQTSRLKVFAVSEPPADLQQRVLLLHAQQR